MVFVSSPYIKVSVSYDRIINYRYKKHLVVGFSFYKCRCIIGSGNKTAALILNMSVILIDLVQNCLD